MAFISFLLERFKTKNEIEPEPLSFFLSRKKGMVYGAGRQARILLDCASIFKKEILCLIVSKNGYRDIESFYDTIPLYRIDDVPEWLDKNTEVIIGVNEKHNAVVAATLDKHGFTSKFTSCDWDAFNLAIRKLWYQSYLEYYGFLVDKDLNGVSFIKRDFGGGVLKFSSFEDNREWLNNIIVMIEDILAPVASAETENFIEGPYEFGNVTLEQGDTVFDLGANLGLFSSVAAAKGCWVHAFEPAPNTMGYLEKVKRFYPNVAIHPFAVTDSSGVVSFNADLENVDNRDMGRSSILPVDKFAAFNVQAVSLDDFVEQEEIRRVDFIKADIEGAERLMLRGAKRVLAEFAPKLALTTYHLPDDPKVMEQLILTANPNYKIVHKWSKLYAYCPGS